MRPVTGGTCSSKRLGLDDAITRIAEALAERFVVPDDWQCCAFAGDRGLLHPELTASATRAEAYMWEFTGLRAVVTALRRALAVPSPGCTPSAPGCGSHFLRLDRRERGGQRRGAPA